MNEDIDDKGNDKHCHTGQTGPPLLFLQALLFCRHLRLLLAYGLLLDGIRTVRCVDGRVEMRKDIHSRSHSGVLTPRHQVGFVFLQEGQLDILQGIVCRELLPEFIQVTPALRSILPFLGKHLIVGGKNRAVSGLAVVCLFEFGKGFVGLSFLPKTFEGFGTEHAGTAVLLVSVVGRSQSRLVIAGYQTVVAVGPEQQVVEITQVGVVVADIGETDDGQTIGIARRLLAYEAEVLLIGFLQGFCRCAPVQSETALTITYIYNKVCVVAGRVAAHLL